MSLKLINCFSGGLRSPSLPGHSAECHTLLYAIRNEIAGMIEKNIDHIVREKKDEKEDI